jgi:regulator of protease activity HflC (stomatin/prohibitin superfamily)
MNMMAMVGSVLFSAVIGWGCASSPPALNESASSMRSSASLYRQLAKEEVENARKLSANGEGEQAESMLLRAQADSELAAALSRTDADKTESAQLVEQVRQLRQYNRLHQAMEKQ